MPLLQSREDDVHELHAPKSARLAAPTDTGARAELAIRRATSITTHPARITPHEGPATSLRRIAFLGTHLPRICGVATFTADLRAAVALAAPQTECMVAAMTDEAGPYDYPTVGTPLWRPVRRRPPTGNAPPVSPAGGAPGKSPPHEPQPLEFAAMRTIVNKTFEEIALGDAVSVERTLQAGDVRAWATAFGELDAQAGPAESQGATGIVTAILTALAGSALPGPGTSIRAISVQIMGALPIGAAMTARLLVRKKLSDQGIVVLDGQCADPGGQVVATATLEVLAPTNRQQRQVAEHRLEGLIERCRGLEPMLTGVVHPCSADALASAVEAAEARLIVPVLFGPEAEIRQVADKARLDFGKCRIVSTDGPEDSALKAATAAGAGRVAALMKGSLHTDVLLHAVMQKEATLRAGPLISHCAMISVPTYARRFVISDVALNIAPDTDQKRDICQNAIGFARALGIELPKVAVLAAVEMVRTKMPASLDGAILAKMADRRQIVGGIVDGPLDLDAAVDAEAARIKHITSPVAGLADLLIAPNIEAGNMVYKNLAFMADAQTAGLVVGARVPVILTSRADTAAARRFSAAAAVLYADALARDPTDPAARNGGVIDHEQGHHRRQRGLDQPEVRRLRDGCGRVAPLLCRGRNRQHAGRSAVRRQ